MAQATTKGYRTINNGIENQQIRSTDPLPEGWVYGLIRYNDGKDRDQRRVIQLRRWRNRNRDKTNDYVKKFNTNNPEKKLSQDLKYNYGITLEQYNTMLEAQDFKCAICGTDDPSCGSDRHKRFCVDHCHDSNEVRGLLCLKCNVGLGAFDDNIENMEKAITYLRDKK